MADFRESAKIALKRGAISGVYIKNMPAENGEHLAAFFFLPESGRFPMISHGRIFWPNPLSRTSILRRFLRRGENRTKRSTLKGIMRKIGPRKC